MQVDNDHELRVKFYTRSFMPEGAEDIQERVLDRLDDLCERDVLDDFECEIWGKRVSTSSRPAKFGHDAIETVGQFRTWAEANGASLLPFFDERTQRSKITGEEHSEIIFPMMCMAVYRDDNLVGVYPHADEESVTTIPDLLAALSDGPENAELPKTPGATLA